MKLHHIWREGGTLIEDYTTMGTVALFLILYLILKGNILRSDNLENYGIKQDVFHQFRTHVETLKKSVEEPSIILSKING